MDWTVIKSTLTGGFHTTSLDGYKPASVLVVICRHEPHIIMIEKSGSMRIHAGEISFPGGKYEECDVDMMDTALRETAEEIGLDVRRDQVTGQLSGVTTLNSGFVICPFVAILDDIPKLSPNPEVEEILCIPLERLLKTMAVDSIPEHRTFGEMYTFQYNSKVIWGASARILRQIAVRIL